MVAMLVQLLPKDLTFIVRGMKHGSRIFAL